MKSQKQSAGFVRILIIPVFAVAGLFAYILLTKDSTQSLTSLVTTKTQLTPTPTPTPFAEMTIPTLRARKYESNLGELKMYSDGGNYTSYLTNYKSDGLTVNGLLTVPKGRGEGEKLPAIVFVHGYIPPTLYGTTKNYVAYVDYLARNGFVVFKIDLRGHGQSEGEAGGGYYSSDYVVDTLNAIAALKKSEFVNPDKIGLWGHSMAGNVLLRTYAVNPDIPAVVIWAGAGYTYTDLQTYRLNDNSYRPPVDNSNRQRKREALFAAHGQFDPNSDFWKKVAPTNYLGDLKGNLALHHSVDDTVVSVEYSRNLVSLLEKQGSSYEVFEYQSGGHNISGAAFSQAMKRTVDFYKKYLQ